MSVNSTGLSLLSHIKNFHWNAKTYAEHKALDSLYSEFSDKLDSMMECLLGRGAKKEKLSFYEFTNRNEMIDFAISFFENISNEREPEISNIAADIVGVFTKHKYLLSLK